VLGFARFDAGGLAATSDVGSKALWAFPLSKEARIAAEVMPVALFVFPIFRISAYPPFLMDWRLRAAPFSPL
jgi:hypothetical protein